MSVIDEGATDLGAVLHGPLDLRVEAIPKALPGPDEVRVAIQGVGLCGSDLHYYADGRNGANVVRAPLVLGHEAFGLIEAVGAGVDPARIGTRVAIEPARPCGRCATCRAGRYNLCPAGTCYGSPPTHGALRTGATVLAEFAHPIPDTVSDSVAALIEPLAVACWAVHRARVRPGQRVLVTGAGPIGLLTAAVLNASGVAGVVISDVDPNRLAIARRLDLGSVVDAREELPALHFDRLLECSGSPAALRALHAVAPGGVAALVGIPAAEPATPLGVLQRWEIDLVTCFRYGPGAFATAISLAARGAVNLEPFVTARFPLTDAAKALRTALEDRSHLKIVVEPDQENTAR